MGLLSHCTRAAVKFQNKWARNSLFLDREWPFFSVGYCVRLYFIVLEWPCGVIQKIIRKSQIWAEFDDTLQKQYALLQQTRDSSTAKLTTVAFAD